MDGDMRALPSEGCSEVIDYGGFIMNASQEMQAVIKALPEYLHSVSFWKYPFSLRV